MTYSSSTSSSTPQPGRRRDNNAAGLAPPLHLYGPNIPTAKISHGFFTRIGGVSVECYAELNCGRGSADEPERVAENRRRVAACLGVEAAKLLTAHQIHSADTHIVDGTGFGDKAPKVDALVTNVPGVAIAVLTADCTPILLCDPTHGIIGAAHAGWRGAVGGVIESVVGTMVKLGAKPEHIRAAVGPTISVENYQVGDAFRRDFLQRDQANGRFFVEEDGDHYRFNLPAFVHARLIAAGVNDISDVGICTYRDSERFFSFRRATHRAEPDYGRQISAIALNACT